MDNPKENDDHTSSVRNYVEEYKCLWVGNQPVGYHKFKSRDTNNDFQGLSR